MAQSLQLRSVLHELLLLPQVVSVLLVLCPLLALLIVRRFGRRTPSTATAGSRREQLLSKLPSPPGRLPVIGHLHLVGSLPHVSLRDLAARHGRDGLMLLRLGAVPTLVVSSPRAAQAVLRTHDHVFASRAYSPVTDILFYGSTDVAFAPYGEHWRQVKKIATTHLLANRKVRSYRHAREQEVGLAVAKIREAAAVGRNRLFRELVETNASLIGGFNVEDYFPVLVKLDVVKRMVCAKAERTKRIWDQVLEKLIDDHARRPPASERDDGEEISDFIDVLLSVQQEYNLTRDHIKAQLAVMFEAGTDTSFIVLEYAMAHLMRNPRLMTKLQAELRGAMPNKVKEVVTEDEIDTSNLAYLKAVIKETLRLHMPAPLLVPHLSMADCDIEGYTIPSGTRVIINSWALARDPSCWQSAEEFKPERFMEGGSAAAIDYKGNDFVFLPFGAGRRMCPGMNFGIATIEVMLANLIYHFNWELPAESPEKGIDMTESFGVTVHRTEKLLLVPIVPQD